MLHHLVHPIAVDESDGVVHQFAGQIGAGLEGGSAAGRCGSGAGCREYLDVIDIIRGGRRAAVEGDGKSRARFHRVIQALVCPVRPHRRILAPFGTLVFGIAVSPDVNLQVRGLVRTGVPGDAVGLSGLDREGFRNHLHVPAVRAVSVRVVHLQGQGAAVGRFVRDAHIVRTVHLHEKAGRGELARTAGREVFKVDATVNGVRVHVIVAGGLAGTPVFPKNTDIVDDDILGDGKPVGEVADGFRGKGDGILAPVRRNACFGFLAITGDNLHGAFPGQGLGPERNVIGLARLDGGIDLQGGAVGDGLRGIVAGKDVIQARNDFKTVCDKTVQGAGLEIPVLPDEGGVVVPDGLGNHGVQIIAPLLAVPAQRVAEQVIPARLRPSDHLVSGSEVVSAVRLHDGVVLHLVAERDGGEVTLQDVLDGRVQPIFPIGERNAQPETSLLRQHAHGILVIIHHLDRRGRGSRRIRSHLFPGRVVGGDERLIFRTGAGHRQESGQQDQEGQLLHFHRM